MLDSLDIFHFCMTLVHLWIKLAILIYAATSCVCEYIISCANPKSIASRYIKVLYYCGERLSKVVRANCKIALANFDAVCSPDSTIRRFCHHLEPILRLIRFACAKLYEAVY